MENKQYNGFKNVIFLFFVFLGILIGVTFISTTILILLKVSTDFIIEKGIVSDILLSIILTAIIKYKRSHKIFNFRYWFSFIIFIAGIIITVLMGGGKILTLIDIPSLMMVGIIPFLFISILFSFREMALAFSIQSIKEPDKEALQKAFLFFDMYGKINFVAGLMAAIIEILSMFNNFNDIDSVLPIELIALLPIFYSCIIYVLVIMPYIIFIKNKMAACDNCHQ
jgi:hypothetical protein